MLFRSVQTWFLPAIIIWQVIIYFAMKLYKNCYFDFALSIITFAIGYYFSQTEDICFFMFCMSIYTGYIFTEAGIRKKRVVLSLIQPVVLGFVMIATLCLYLYFRTYVTGIIWSLSVFLFFWAYPFRLNRFVEFLSSNSFGIYLIHFVFLQLGTIVGQILHWNMNTVVFTLSNIIVSFLVSLLVSSLFKRNRILKNVV